MTKTEEHMTDKESASQESVSVKRFMEIAARALEVELMCGEKGVDKDILEAAINRAGMALTGFYEHFANNRIQVIGLAEHTYLSSLSDSDRKKRLEEFFDSNIPCLVVTRGQNVFDEIKDIAGKLSVPVLRTNMETKHFINAATIIMENLIAPTTKIQGTMIEIIGIGVMIEGKPGMGKSETALALIKRGAALVADDITAIRLDSSGSLIASPVDITKYHMEIRGLGIIHIPSLFGVGSVRKEKKLQLVVTLREPGPHDVEERGQHIERSKNILGVEVSQVHVSVRSGRDIANIIETAALDYKLKILGHDAAKELDKTMMDMMSGGRNGSD